MAGGIYNYSYACRHRHTADSGDIGVGLSAAGPDPDRARLIGTVSPNVDVVTSTKNADPGIKAYRNVIRTGGEKTSRNTDRRVTAAREITCKRRTADRHVV